MVAYACTLIIVDYQGLNNLTIENQYPVPLISKSLDRLGWAKWFIKLDLYSVYHRIKIWENDV